MDTNPLVLAAVDYWSSVLPSPLRADWLTSVSIMADAASQRRSKADYNTGSIAWMEAYQLCALANSLKARVVIEVGTFIGTSTMALAMGEALEALYTCDMSNDCVPRSETVHPYPKQSSTQMFHDLKSKGVRADLCFFDGVLSDVDADLLLHLTHAGTVFAFHDYNYGPKVRRKGKQTYVETLPRKGIGNVALLAPRLPHHVLVEPIDSNTIALLVPEAA